MNEPKFEIGDRVRVINGQPYLLFGTTGTVVDKPGKDLVSILIRSLGSQPYWIHEDNLELIQKYYAPLIEILDELNITLL